MQPRTHTAGAPPSPRSSHGSCPTDSRLRPRGRRLHTDMSVFVWSMVGIAIWHFTVFVPDRFAGGIVGAFLAAWIGGVASGFVIEGFALPSDNPPGMRHAL